ncbi:zinc finger MYM-type protein 1-like protein, partial [Tanacetum coccineum]
MNKKRTIDSFYKPIKDVVREPETVTQTQNQTNGDNIMEESPKSVRPPLSYPSNQQDEIRRTYIRLGPYQLVKAHYPLSPCGFHKRMFQAAWFRRFWWLEYSDKKDAAFCFPYYLFGRKPIGRARSDTFTAKGFNNWRKVNSGTACPFMHNFSVRCYEDLKNKVCHIKNVIDKQTEQEIMDNRYSDKKDAAFCFPYYLFGRKPIGRAGSDTFTAKDIQKESLQMFAMEVQEAIRDEIGTAKFCLIVDESQDESKKEQMAIVVRFVDRNGYIKERFLDLVHVKDTNAPTLKNDILSSLYHLKLYVQDIRGSSTMRNDELQDAQLAEISYLAEIGELEGGRGANQMQNIQRPGDTRWSSHFKSICSLVRLFGPTRV